MKKIFKAAFSYTAALVGAGFASGQEIVTFFVRYGKMSIFGILFCAVIFGVFASLVMEVCFVIRTDSYEYFLSEISSCRVQKWLKILGAVFSAAVMCVMAACSGEIIYVIFGVKEIYGSALMCVMCMLILINGQKSTLNINALIGAVLVIGITAFGFYILGYREHQVFAAHSCGIISSVSYCGYNLITAGAVLAGLSSGFESRRDIRLCAAASACMMLVMMLLMWFILSIYYGKINLGEIPMLTMTYRQNDTAAVLYGIIISAAVLTTAAANGLCACELINSGRDRKFTAAAVCIIAFAFGTAGFSTLINTAYRWCGYAGIAASGYIIFKSIKFLKNSENRRF